MTTINTIGRITRDFELKTSDKIGVYANFGLAVNEGYGDNEKTTYFECAVYGADAERIIKAKAKKGSLIQITGRFGVSDFARANGDSGYSLKISVYAWSYIPGVVSQNGNGNGNGQNGDSGQDSVNSVGNSNGNNHYANNGSHTNGGQDFYNENDPNADDLPF